MRTALGVTQIGLGPLGQMITPYLSERSGIEIVGAADIDPELAGKDLGDLCNIGSLNTVITNDLDTALENAQVAIITTVSELERLFPLLEQVLLKGIHVVSTCEELSYPWKTQPDLAKKLDDLAQAHGVSVLGTGINPGFLMDFLPIASTAICREVKSVRIERIQDASIRRLPFQQKIGAGLTPEAFQERVDQHKIRHVGLTESMHMIAARMGWDLDKTEDVVKPVIAETDLSGPGWSVSAGMATGVNQTGHGYIGEQEVLTLVFRAAVGQTDPKDAIFIHGTPELNLVIPGGVNGDIATCSIITNAIPIVAEAPPGLRTMADIPPISCFA